MHPLYASLQHSLPGFLSLLCLIFRVSIGAWMYIYCSFDNLFCINSDQLQWFASSPTRCKISCKEYKTKQNPTGEWWRQTTKIKSIHLPVTFSHSALVYWSGWSSAVRNNRLFMASSLWHRCAHHIVSGALLGTVESWFISNLCLAPSQQKPPNFLLVPAAITDRSKAGILVFDSKQQIESNCLTSGIL